MKFHYLRKIFFLKLQIGIADLISYHLTLFILRDASGVENNQNDSNKENDILDFDQRKEEHHSSSEKSNQKSNKREGIDHEQINTEGQPPNSIQIPEEKLESSDVESQLKLSALQPDNNLQTSAGDTVSVQSEKSESSSQTGSNSDQAINSNLSSNSRPDRGPFNYKIPPKSIFSRAVIRTQEVLNEDGDEGGEIEVSESQNLMKIKSIEEVQREKKKS